MKRILSTALALLLIAACLLSGGCGGEREISPSDAPPSPGDGPVSVSDSSPDAFGSESAEQPSATTTAANTGSTEQYIIKPRDVGSKPTIEMTEVYGETGSTVKLEIIVHNNPGIIALRLGISYDADKLELVEAADKGFFGEGMHVFGNNIAANPYILTWDDSLGTKNHTNNGLLAELRFKVKSDLGASGAVVTLDIRDSYDFDLNDVSFTALNGRVCKKPAPTTTTTTTAAAVDVSELDAKVVRMAGGSRIETAIEISKLGWSKSDTVLLTNAARYPDALSGVPLAYALDAPILLTAGGDAPEAAVLDEIKRLGAKTAVILGGASAVSEEISDRLSSLGLKVERLEGTSRYETSVAIARKLNDVSKKKPSEVFLVSGENFPDALAVSSIAAIKGMPIIYLPANGSVDSTTAAYLKEIKCSSAVLVGGDAAVSGTGMNSVMQLGIKVERISGGDRYDTALRIYRKYDSVFTSDDIAVATGANFPDALAGGVYAAKKGVPVVLVGGSPAAEVIGYVGEKSCKNAYVFGGGSVVSDRCIYELLK